MAGSGKWPTGACQTTSRPASKNSCAWICSTYSSRDTHGCPLFSSLPVHVCIRTACAHVLLWSPIQRCAALSPHTFLSTTEIPDLGSCSWLTVRVECWRDAHKAGVAPAVLAGPAAAWDTGFCNYKAISGSFAPCIHSKEAQADGPKLPQCYWRGVGRGCCVPITIESLAAALSGACLSRSWV